MGRRIEKKIKFEIDNNPTVDVRKVKSKEKKITLAIPILNIH